MGMTPEATLEMDERWWLAAQRAESREWSMQTELLATIYDTLQTLIYVTIKLHRPKAQLQASKPYPRPWQKDDEPQRVRMSALEYAKTQVGPKQRRRQHEEVGGAD